MINLDEVLQSEHLQVKEVLLDNYSESSSPIQVSVFCSSKCARNTSVDDDANTGGHIKASMENTCAAGFEKEDKEDFICRLGALQGVVLALDYA